MGDRIEYVNGRNYLRTDNGVGISFQLDYGFRVDYEHVFTSSTDNLGDMNRCVCVTTSNRTPAARCACAYRAYESRGSRYL